MAPPPLQVAYNNKHNEANGENNRDGEQHNNSWNCGEEGPTTKWEVNVSHLIRVLRVYAGAVQGGGGGGGSSTLLA